MQLSITFRVIYFFILLGYTSRITAGPAFELTLEERVDLQKQEPELRNAVVEATEEYGEDSQEKADALHKLGRVLYKLEKYAGLRSTAKEIARIEGLINGHDSVKYAYALRNVGSVAHRLEMKEESLRYMMRALNILGHHFDDESQEISYHKSIMLTYDQKEYYLKHPGGMPHKQFKKIEKKKKFSFNLDEL